MNDTYSFFSFSEIQVFVFRWTTRCVLPAAIGFAKMLSLSGKLFLLGGAGSIGGGGSCSLSDILVWDPSKEDLQWQHIGNLAIARHGHTLGYLGSKRKSILRFLIKFF